jgi:Spy/CpxP family protein refolding chaperone
MNPRSTIIATALGLAGFAGLAIAATTVLTPAVPPAPPAAAPGAAIPARVAEKLGLTAEQQKAMAELRARQRDEMMALLTPEQQKMAAEMRGRLGERLEHFAEGRRQGGGFDRGPGQRGHAGMPGPAMMPPPPNPLETIAQADRIKDRLADQLQLSDAQRDQIEHLGRAFRAAQRDAAKKHLEEMRAVLTAEQQQKMEQLKQRFQRGRDGGHPPRFGLNDEPDDGEADLADGPPPPEES